MSNSLRLTGAQHEKLMAHLFPGDGNEAVALALCGRLETDAARILCVHDLLLVDHSACRERTPLRVTWPTEIGRRTYEKAAEKSMAVLKIHSHPGYYPQFSEVDDESDLELFKALHSWCDDGLPHGSAVMLPGGAMFGRLISGSGDFTPLDRISVVGDDILIFEHLEGHQAELDEVQLRTRQTFGDRTSLLLAGLTVAIIGCSGTGSWVIEQLARLGVGRLILIDPKIAEARNLNRIIGIDGEDVKHNEPKVFALKKHIEAMGTGTQVIAHHGDIFDEVIARQLAGADVIFGCMDSVEGRAWLNRIAAFYLVPYFDLGVRLDADGDGGISTVCGNVNYILPDGSSLMSRGCISSDALRAETLRRKHPEQYELELQDGYIKGVKVESPAVVSINGFCAAMAVNELLARLHPYRSSSNREHRRQQFDLKNGFWNQLDDSEPCPLLSRLAGRGDMKPFLDAVSDA
ncbi:MAG: ThiF family adenylyltransferase [Luteolibacter sp.]|uniref:ThiF family adenylyltransferase n=1 Tax=Luteolibacter sp. TaxID=1962973 RepID=UPI0032677D95